jgi:tetratricopeptide (TPR) repeat protein
LKKLPYQCYTSIQLAKNLKTVKEYILKNWIFLKTILLLIILLICFSCKSTSTPAPTPTQTPPPTQTPDSPPDSSQVSQAELNEARNRLETAKSRVEAARKRAIDFECPAYFPSEWEAVETRYEAARAAPQSNLDEVQKATVLFNDVADAYDDLFNKTIQLYAQAREDEILAVRNELINSGFTQFIPEHLKNADEKAISAKDQYNAGDYYEAKDTAAEALADYETLLMGAKAFLAKQEIENNGFQTNDSDNFNKADELAQAAMREYEAGNKDAAKANAQEALDLFNTILENGWTAQATEWRDLASKERELAMAEKANIASRDLFNNAESPFNQANADFASKKFQSASVLYKNAKELYTAARQDTEEKRLRAIEMIKLAEEKIEESSETAIEAERVIEGGSK